MSTSDVDAGDPLPIALRAYIERVPPRERTPYTPKALGWPEYALVFDTETTTDPTQRLLIGSYRVGRLSETGAFEPLEEGLFYADDLPTTDPAAFATIQQYVQGHVADTVNPRRRGLQLYTRRDFVNQRLRKALEAGALIVGYNLPFDMCRIAIDAGAARGEQFGGGFSMTLFDYDVEPGVSAENPHGPRFRFKAIDSRRALMGLAKQKGMSRAERQHPELAPRFLDLKALVFALTDRHYSLDRAAEAFGLPARKLAVEEHGRVTEAYIDYNRQDVAVTAALLEAVWREWNRHPVTLSPDKVMSPAGLAKGYLRAMGVVPPWSKAPADPEMMGVALSAYYGGRTEVRIRRVPVPVAYHDFLSMYPTVDALMAMWAILTAEKISYRDATARVQALGDALTLDGCFDPAFWSQLRFFALVQPAWDILPVRARYNPASDATSIGVNPLWSDTPVWFAGPDLVASFLLTGRFPMVLRAVEVVPDGRQAGLQPVLLRGQIPIDPIQDDFFRRVIEARHALKTRTDLEEDERKRLDRFLKVAANSGAYGIFAELNVKPAVNTEAGDPVRVYGGDAAFDSRTIAPEDPGEFFFGPQAALITAGARCMLALLERLVADAGGVIAFGDTDSAAIVSLPDGGLVPCPGGAERLPDGTPAVRALSREQVERIRERFEALNPYDRAVVPGSILKLEPVNFAPDGAPRVVYAFAISAKRYALFTRWPGGEVEVVAAKEHGLGHLRNPTDITAENRKWIETLWTALIREALGEPFELPAWASRPAVSRVTVSTPDVLATFRVLNDGLPYAAQIKPTNFGLSVTLAATSAPVEIDPERFHLLGPFESDPAQWGMMPWYDKYSGRSYRIGVGRDIPADAIQVKSFGDVVDEYRVHPEPKSLGPDGTPCHRGTVGLLRRRPVYAAGVVYLGKESNRYEEVQLGLVHRLADVQQAYPHPTASSWAVLVVPVLQLMPKKALARAVGISPRQVQAYRNTGAQPTPETAARLLEAITRWARRALRRPNLVAAHRTCLERFLRSPFAAPDRGQSAA